MEEASFGDWLKRNRRARRLTQSALETEARLGDNYVSKVERGELRLPGEEVRARIHAVFGTTDDDLVREGILERIEIRGHDPVYVPASSPPVVRPARAVAETEERYDAIDARYRLRLRAEQLTEAQAEAVLALLDTFGA